ncbi:MAG: hypothetical protein PHQ00_02320 [Phycisphaerae bacterium]|nr:hypothetical protein [Phycisphaerae bacterium]
MTFCTAINCLDGRVQEPAVAFLKKHYGVKYVDMITEAGPVQYLTDKQRCEITDSILKRVELTVLRHNPNGIAIMAHYDCLGNPVPEEIQKQQLKEAAEFLKKHFPKERIETFWIDGDWQVNEI